jgi:glutathione S-transferase
MLTIWGRLNSHNVKKVAWFPRELGIVHVRHDMGGQFGMSEAYLKLNPNALVPTIEEDGLVLWESNAILRYMAARHGGERFWPSDPAERAKADKWMDWQFSFADAQRDAFLNLVRRPEAERDKDGIARSAELAGRMMQRVEETLDGAAWLSGAAFGVGDIPMGVYAHTFFTLDLERPDLPKVRAWYERLKSRGAYAETVMIPLT